MKDDESMFGQSFNMHIRKTRELRQKKETPTKQCHGTSVRKKQRQTSNG